MRSPLDQWLQDTVEHHVLASQSVHDGLDDSVALSFILQNGTCLVLRHIRDEPIGGNIAELLSHGAFLDVLEGSVGVLELLGEHFELRPLQVITVVLIVFTLAINITRNVLNLTATLLHSRVQLHGVVSGVLQGLLQVSNLSGQFALRCYTTPLNFKMITYICPQHSSSEP